MCCGEQHQQASVRSMSDDFDFIKEYMNIDDDAELYSTEHTYDLDLAADGNCSNISPIDSWDYKVFGRTLSLGMYSTGRRKPFHY